VRQAVITPKRKAMTDRVDTARERIGRAIFETRDAHDIEELVRLLRKFADAVSDERKPFRKSKISGFPARYDRIEIATPPPGRRPAFTVYRSRRHMAARTRVVIDFLVARFKLLKSRLRDGRDLGENDAPRLV
jgi:hypothetical protein